jgi:Domain of unknown function (DUF4160)
MDANEQGFWKSQRDFIVQPGVAKSELRRVSVKQNQNPKGVLSNGWSNDSTPSELMYGFGCEPSVVLAHNAGLNDSIPLELRNSQGQWDQSAEIKVNINTLEVMEGDLRRRARALVLEWAALHRAELRQAQELASRNQEPSKIAPLMDERSNVGVHALACLPMGTS